MVASLQFQAALAGNLDGFQSDVRGAVAEAGRGTLESIKDKGLVRLRGSLRDAGLGMLDKSWRAEIYPRNGNAIEPAILFYSKADQIVRANEGETIRAGNGKKLAIPIPGSPAESFPNPRGPETKVDYARQKFGDRLFVIPANRVRPAILAAEGVGLTKTGRVTLRKKTKTGKWGKGTATIFLFWLVDEAVMQQRLDVAADFERISREFESEYPRQLANAIKRAGL
jgi:hypothetical protein